MNPASTDLDERITSIDLGARREKRSLGMDCGRELRRQLWRAPGPNPIGTIKLSESCVINFFISASTSHLTTPVSLEVLGGESTEPGLGIVTKVHPSCVSRPICVGLRGLAVEKLARSLHWGVSSRLLRKTHG